LSDVALAVGVPHITELAAARIRTITRRDFNIRRCSKLRLRHAFSFFGELSTKIPQRNPSFSLNYIVSLSNHRQGGHVEAGMSMAADSKP